MLPREYRLTKEEDFKKLYRSRQTYRSALLTVRAGRNIHNRPRFGFVISKKTAKHATDRNKLKRWFRVIIAKHLSEYEKYGKDVVILAHKSPKESSFREIEDVLTKLLKKAMYG